MANSKLFVGNLPFSATEESVRALLPPQPYGYGRDRETFDSKSGLTFDPFAAAESSVEHSLGLLLNNALPVQMTLYVAANLMMIALGLYLTGLTGALAFTERIGHRLWQRVQPLTKRFLPVRGVAQALPLGMLWGWLPCGMVYSVLAMALLTGSAARGAATLLAFGLGTLPNLMLAGLLLVRFRNLAQAPALRIGSGLVVLAFGAWGLYNASSLGGRLWQGVVCTT